MGIVSILFLGFPGLVVGFFTQQEEVRQYAISALRIISTGYIFYGVGRVMINAFNGAGDTRTPTVINVFCFWAFQLPLAYLLARYFALGPVGVFIAIPVAETLVTVTAFLLFKKGRWKTVKV